MSSNLSVQQVLSALLPTFESVTVKTLAFSINERLCNVVTTISFDEQQVPAAEEATEAMIHSQDGFGDGRLRFRYKVLPCARWPELIEEFSTGSVAFESDLVDMMRPVGILDSKGYIDRITFLRSPFGWPLFESHLTLGAGQTSQAESAQKVRSVQHDQDLVRNLSANGYRSLNEVAQIFLQSRADGEPSYESDVYVAIPVYAAIRRLQFRPKERRLYASFNCRTELRRDIRIFGERRSLPRGDERVDFSTPETEAGEFWVASAALDLEQSTAGINVWLTHHELGVITSRNATPNEILPPEEVNPLWTLLQVFCPSAEFETLLTVPSRPKDRRQKEQRCFEQYVAWLLALHGFSVVVLGDFETLQAPGSPVQQGSLDILAYHTARKRVLMCSCTLTPPEERDYGNLVSVRTHLRSCVSSEVSFEGELAIFSSAAECVPPPHYMGQGTYVAIFDRRDLKNALENLKAGTDRQFFNKLDGPELGIAWTF